MAPCGGPVRRAQVRAASMEGGGGVAYGFVGELGDNEMETVRLAWAGRGGVRRGGVGRGGAETAAAHARSKQTVTKMASRRAGPDGVARSGTGSLKRYIFQLYTDWI